MTQYLFDKNLAASLSLALDAQDVFQSYRQDRSETLRTDNVEEYEESRLSSLRSKLHLSYSPTLAILQMLLADEHIHKSFEQYAGIWMTSLNVVVAKRPSLLSARLQDPSKRRGATGQRNRQRSATASPNSELLASPTGSAGSLRASPTPWMDANDSRKKSLANALSSKLQQHQHLADGGDGTGTGTGTGNYHDNARVAQNKEREAYVRELLALRVGEAKRDKELAYTDALRGFCEDPLDGNRLMLTYVKQRWLFAKQAETDADMLKMSHTADLTTGGHESATSDAAASAAAAYDRKLTEMQMTHKRVAFSALQSFKASKAEAERLHEKLVADTREWCAKNLNPVHRSKSISLVSEGPDSDGTTNILHDNHTGAARIYNTDDLSSVESKEMAKLSALEESLRQEREILKKFSDSKLKSRLSSLAEKDAQLLIEGRSDRSAKLAELNERVKKSTQALYSAFVDRMGASAQASMAALDQRFVQGSIMEDDRTEMFNQLVWDMSERKWQLDAAEDTRRNFCQNLAENLDERLRAANKNIFAYELERIEGVNSYNARNGQGKKYGL
jgi:hypothetical protein